MPLLQIDLQEGFTDDAVEIRINGVEHFSRSGVKTRMQIGLATSLEGIEVPQGTTHIEVTLPQKHLSKTITVPVIGPTYMAVSISRAGQIEYQLSSEPFGYV
jgi:hypothetical protein